MRFKYMYMTFFLEGLGIMGDIVKVPKKLWRNFLCQARLATYPTPENIVELSKEIKVCINVSFLIKILFKNFVYILFQKCKIC